MVSSAHAAVVTYTLSGGTISGTLGGVSFTGASYTITADADPSNFVPGTVFTIPVLSQSAVSTMTIDGFAPFQITTANFGIFLADASSLYGARDGLRGIWLLARCQQPERNWYSGASAELIGQRDRNR